MHRKTKNHLQFLYTASFPSRIFCFFSGRHGRVNLFLEIISISAFLEFDGASFLNNFCWHWWFNKNVSQKKTAYHNWNVLNKNIRNSRYIWITKRNRIILHLNFLRREIRVRNENYAVLLKLQNFIAASTPAPTTKLRAREKLSISLPLWTSIVLLWINKWLINN